MEIVYSMTDATFRIEGTPFATLFRIMTEDFGLNEVKIAVIARADKTPEVAYVYVVPSEDIGPLKVGRKYLSVRFPFISKKMVEKYEEFRHNLWGLVYNFTSDVADNELVDCGNLTESHLDEIYRDFLNNLPDGI
jgi:hypothetical protein